MAKNKTELQKELTALGEQLGAPVELEQTNDDLIENIKELQARIDAQSDLAEDPEADETAAAEPQTEEQAADEPETEEQAADAPQTEELATEKMAVIRALKTFQTTDLGEKVRCKKNETVVVTVQTAQLCIADKVAVAVSQ